MDIKDFVSRANNSNIDLGSNPVRTIRYYISIGILQKPEIVQIGKKRKSYFNDEHFSQLRIINHYKKQGLSLQEIKDRINGTIFWSDEALRLIEKYRNEIPADVFKKYKPVTREEMAFFISRFFLNENDSNLNIKDYSIYFVDKDGKPLGIPFV